MSNGVVLAGRRFRHMRKTVVGSARASCLESVIVWIGGEITNWRGLRVGK